MVYPKKKKQWPAHMKTVQILKAKAEALGEVVAYKPVAQRVDGSPLLREGEVYVTVYGKAFHPAWCEHVANKWDTDRKGLFVTRRSEVGRRTECASCVTPLTSAHVPAKLSTPGLDREHAEKLARKAAGEARRNGR
jgi:hypothetical protein